MAGLWGGGAYARVHPPNMLRVGRASPMQGDHVVVLIARVCQFLRGRQGMNSIS